MLKASEFSFPDPATTDLTGDGLIGFGADLAPTTLIKAYQSGIFPWFSEDEPIAWWSPPVRAVFKPDIFKASRSLKRSVRRGNWRFEFNQDFESVIRNCADTRFYVGTWITEQMIEAYTELHRLGFAHSFEVYDPENELIGGVYGLKIGKVFCGESMFHHVTDASKASFWFMSECCHQSGIELIDAQLENPHLMSLGALLIPKADFLQQLNLLKTQLVDWSGPTAFDQIAQTLSAT